jgi:hypothetical protein
VANDVKLGVSGSEVTLPTCIALSLPTNIDKQMTSATMSDGTVRYAFYAEQRSWQISWTDLTAAQLSTLLTLRGYNQSLRFQNNFDSSTWYTVVITAFSYDAINPGESTIYYTASMQLAQTV